MAWILVPALVSLRNEFNMLAPSRDKGSDGSVGDTSHAASVSDHNPDETGNPEEYDSDHIDEVHAIDVDKDLRQVGWSMERAVNIIVSRHKAGKDNRLKYVIWNRRIASANSGWAWVSYSGSNPHDHHAHFSCRYTTAAESNTQPWGLLAAEEDDMALSADDKTWISGELVKIRNACMKESHDAVEGFFWNAHYAATNSPNFQKASVDDQKAMRNARDILRSVMGGPVDLAQVIATLGQVKVDTDQIVTKLVAPPKV